MELFKDPAQQRFFDRISGLKPKNFGEYSEAVSSAAREISDTYGISRIDCQFSASQKIPFMPDFSGTLYQDGGEEEGKPASFQYDFPNGSSAKYLLFFKKGRLPDEETLSSLEILFRQFYYVLNTMVFENFCRKVQTIDFSTGIPNLEAFMQFCDERIKEGKIGRYTALYFNVRNFKSIHRVLTYLEGNSVMEKYCQIVSNAVTKREFVARLGGDNFAAIVLDENKDYFFDLIQNMVIKYTKEEKVHTFMFGATIGAAKLTEEKNSGEIMMRISIAYQNARENRIFLSYFDSRVSFGILERKIILSNFFKAIGEREFVVVYQPKVGVKNRTLLGAEALVRWRHDNGIIMPGSFIPILERDGCICTLDFYMLEEVCKFQKRMIEEENIVPVKISVNFSKRHLSNNKLVEEIVEIIDRYEVPHCCIEIELTESEDYHNNSVMKEIVDDLNVFEIKTSIDDFGTGYSSLGMLRTLQLDTLKIDKSFIPENQNENTEKSMLMLRGVVNLAKSLGLTTVAEGVETPEQLELLESMDCDIVQGFIFDRPLPEKEFIQRLKQRVYVLENER